MRVLAVRQDNNGDVILAGPAIRAIAAHAEVTLLCGPNGVGAARLLPDVADVIVGRAEWIEGSPRPIDVDDIESFIRKITAHRFDRAVIFTSFHQSALPMALLLRLAGIPWIGAYSVDYPGSLLDLRAAIDDDIHEVRRALALSRQSGFPLPSDDDASLRLKPLPDVRDIVGFEPYVVVQPTASVPARHWNPRRMHGLIDRLTQSGLRVVVTGAPSETDFVATIVRDTTALNVCGATSFAQFAAIVRDARVLLVGNSSGIHVSSAVGTPVVTIFPPTIPAVRFEPWGVPFALHGEQDIACRGCRARICPIVDQPCIGNISDDEIIASITRLGALSPCGVA